MIEELQDELRKKGDGFSDCTEIIQNIISMQSETINPKQLAT